MTATTRNPGEDLGCGRCGPAARGHDGAEYGVRAGGCRGFEIQTAWRSAEDQAFSAISGGGAGGGFPPQLRKARYKLWLAIGLCLATAGLHVWGGVVFNSAALHAEALHMLSDSLSYMISLGALHIGQHHPTSLHTFGFDRIETIGALLNVMIIWGMTVPLVVSAVDRIAHAAEHEQPDGRMVCAIGVVGLCVNGTLARCFWNDSSTHSHGNMSQRAAKVHVMGDLLESISVVLAGALVWWQPDWRAADPLCAFLFAILVVMTTGYLLRDIYFILMEAGPRNGVKSKDVLQDLLAIEHVLGCSCLHVWQFAPGEFAPGDSVSWSKVLPGKFS
eukprot:COSAG01_NODE_7705_length_3091_cov_29.961230_4_plen_332_part_00